MPDVIDQTAAFGPPPVASTDIDDAILTCLREWAEDYFSQTERERGLAHGFLARPREENYVNALSSMEFLDQMLPTVVVTTAPTEGTPQKVQGGVYNARFRVVTSCIVRGPDKVQTRYNAAWTEATIRRIIAQEACRVPPSLVADAKWMGSGVAPVADTTGQNRYLAAGTCTFDISVDKALTDWPGPTIPSGGNPYPPPPPLGMVTMEHIHVVQRPDDDGDDPDA